MLTGPYLIKQLLKETEASLGGTIPNPTAVGAEESVRVDHPEGVTREDGASEPMPQPAHGDQVNKGVISGL